jgi:CheY-like chemotaxis protein
MNRAMTARTVLVVDDSRSARFAMRRFLENLGYAVDTAETAEAALGYLRSNSPEVVFLDHIMPGTDGLMALKAIKRDAHTARLPVVLCSSNEAEDFLREARACGAADVLPKPPATEQLRQVLERVRRMRSEAAAAAPPAASTAAPQPGAAGGASARPQPAAPSKISFVAAPIDASAATPPAAPEPAVDPQAAQAPAAVPGPPAQDAAAIDTVLAEAAPGAQIEARLRDLAQDFSAQLEALRARLDRQDQPPVPDAAVQKDLALLAQQIKRQVAELRAELESAQREQQRRIAEMLEKQDRRIEQIGADLRRALAEESGTAGARIAEQLADALVRGLRPPRI